MKLTALDQFDLYDTSSAAVGKGYDRLKAWLDHAQAAAISDPLLDEDPEQSEPLNSTLPSTSPDRVPQAGLAQLTVSVGLLGLIWLQKLDSKLVEHPELDQVAPNGLPAGRGVSDPNAPRDPHDNGSEPPQPPDPKRSHFYTKLVAALALAAGMTGFFLSQDPYQPPHDDPPESEVELIRPSSRTLAAALQQNYDIKQTQIAFALDAGVLDTESDRQGVNQYEVQPGDTVWKLTQMFQIDAAAIAVSNGITANTELQPGQILDLPKQTGIVYRVQPGDTLESIAIYYQVPQSDLIQATGMGNPHYLHIGQRIVIPGDVGYLISVENARNEQKRLLELGQDPSSIQLPSRPSQASTAETTTQPAADVEHAAPPASPIDQTSEIADQANETDQASATADQASQASQSDQANDIDQANATNQANVTHPSNATDPTNQASATDQANPTDPAHQTNTLDQPAAAPHPITHTVVSGDTIEELAIRYQVSQRSIIQTNTLTNPHWLSLGQTLTIPSPEAPSTSSNSSGSSDSSSSSGSAETASESSGSSTSSQNPSGSSATSGSSESSASLSANAPAPVPSPPIPPLQITLEATADTVHTVRSGDTIEAIALRYGISQRSIIEANNLQNPNWLRIGQQLTLPGSQSPTSPSSAADPTPSTPAIEPSRSQPSTPAEATQPTQPAPDPQPIQATQPAQSAPDPQPIQASAPVVDPPAPEAVQPAEPQIEPVIEEPVEQPDPPADPVAAAPTAAPPRVIELKPSPPADPTPAPAPTATPITRLTPIPALSDFSGSVKLLTPPPQTVAEPEPTEPPATPRPRFTPIPALSDPESVKLLTPPPVRASTPQPTEPPPTPTPIVKMTPIPGLSPRTPAPVQVIQAPAPTPAPATPPPAPASDGLIWPVDGQFSSGFGWRRGRLHAGIDIAGPVGTPIVAAMEGEVIYAGFGRDGYGNRVDLRHPNGMVTRYAHGSQIYVSVGQYVSQGQTIMSRGSTGWSTGPHLHFEVRPGGGAPVDPMQYLP